MTRKIALVGIGKIARDQHIPVINADPDWELAATVSRNTCVDNIDNFNTLEQLLNTRNDIDTISLTLPTGPRFNYAREALLAGRCVMLEKPPGASIAECVSLERLAREQGVSLFASWHSRASDSVAQCKAWLAEHRFDRMRITWKEDVRAWHPGQEWIWEPGGMGVFDAGINALSIMTEILPTSVHLVNATLETPSNRKAPIAASLRFSHPEGAEVLADFDWRQQGDPIWEIAIQSDDQSFVLSFDGALMRQEYQNLYRRMTQIKNTHAIDMDMLPLIHVADAFMLGCRVTSASFEF